MRISKAITAIALVIAATFHARAQTTPPTPQNEARPVSNHKIPEFEVVSVHQTSPQEINMGGVALHMSTFRFTDDGFQATNTPFALMLTWAYRINDFNQLKGLPTWATEHSTVFNITAKVGEADIPVFKQLNDEDRAAMLRKLLDERFHLIVHRETKDSPVYELVITKSGTKFKETAPSLTASGATASAVKTVSPSIMPGPYQINSHGGSMGALAQALEPRLQRSVLNKTGLTGKYDFVLDWKPEDPSSTQSGDNHEAIFSAIREQLGLALQSTHAPVEFLYVDHVEKPSEN